MITNQDVLDAFNESYPHIDPSWTYCLFTGAPVAQYDSDEFDLMLSLLEGSLQERVESLMIRCLNTSRPSPIWTMVTPTQVEALKERSPCQLLCYLRNGARGLRKDQHDFHAMMRSRIESFIEVCGLDDSELESAFIEYHMEAARKAEEESKAARRMRAWLATRTPEGLEAERRLRIQALESKADAMRLNKWIDEGRKQQISQKAKKLKERKLFMDSVFDEIMNADLGLLKPVDAVLTQPTTAPALNKPAFRIALPKKDS